MSGRYVLYTLGVLAFFALFTYSYHTMHQLGVLIADTQYLNEKIVEQQRFLYAVREAQNPSSTLLKKEFETLFSYTDAPLSLHKNAAFKRARIQHTDLKRTLKTLTSVENPQAVSAITQASEAAKKELLAAQEEQTYKIKTSLSTFVWACAVIIILGTAALAIPFIVRHELALKAAKKTNERLVLKAQELSATHSTMGNMLEDIVHERRQATRTAEINARLAAIINSADDAIFSLNLASIIATANEAAIRVFGDHIIGKRFTSLFSEDISEKLRLLILATGEQKSGATLDVTFEFKKQRKDLSLTLSPIRSDMQKLVGFSVIAKDISNTKLEEERFRLAVEAAPNAMLMINNHGYIVLVNSEVEHMFGFKRDELLGQSIHILVPTNLRHYHSEHIKAYLEQPDRRSMGQNIRELHGQRKNGSRFPIEAGLTPITIEGETYVISSIVDISERIQQQSALEQLNSELKRKNLEMEQFIYAVSHDLKAPLVTIAGFSERLLKIEHIKEDGQASHKIERILSNVKSMDSLLQDLLHLSRVIKRDLEKDWIDTESVIDHTIESLELTIKRQNGELRILRPFPKIYAQESLLFQCVQNIISNSIKYCKPDTPPIITITPVTERNFIGICIADNGIGISDQHQKKIFNVFERLHPDICEGTGVGLSIVKTIIEKHDGKILLDSQEGEGSRFTLLFPVPSISDQEYDYTNQKAV